MSNLTIRLETEHDHHAVEHLTRDAFWNVYKPGCDEHYYVHMLRRHPDFSRSWTLCWKRTAASSAASCIPEPA